jgi:hypothetical protein
VIEEASYSVAALRIPVAVTYAVGAIISHYHIVKKLGGGQGGADDGV